MRGQTKVAALLAAYLLVASAVFAQTHTYPAEDTVNTFSDTNTFTKAVTSPGVTSSTGSVAIGNSISEGVVTVTYASSTTFTASSGNHFKETLTGDVSSSTLSGAVSGTNYYFSICQDGTGSHTFAWPSNFQNAPTITATASKCTNVVTFYDGTNVNVMGQWNTATGGTGSGTVTSVGMTGDGTVFNSSVPGSPVTSSGTLAPTLANAPASYFLGGPIGSLGTNVGVRQSVVCQVVHLRQRCTASFGSPIAIGDRFGSCSVIPVQTSDNYFCGFAGNTHFSTGTGAGNYDGSMMGRILFCDSTSSLLELDIHNIFHWQSWCC